MNKDMKDTLRAITYLLVTIGGLLFAVLGALTDSKATLVIGCLLALLFAFAAVLSAVGATGSVSASAE